MGPTAFATWDEAQLLEIPMTSRHGSADARDPRCGPKVDAGRARRWLIGVASAIRYFCCEIHARIAREWVITVPSASLSVGRLSEPVASRS